MLDRDDLIAKGLSEGLDREQAENEAERELARRARAAAESGETSPAAPPQPQPTEESDAPEPPRSNPHAGDLEGRFARTAEAVAALREDHSKLAALVRNDSRVEDLARMVADLRCRMADCERVGSEAAEGFRELSLRTFQCEQDLGRVPGGVRAPDRSGSGLRASQDVPGGSGDAGAPGADSTAEEPSQA